MTNIDDRVDNPQAGIYCSNSFHKASPTVKAGPSEDQLWEDVANIIRDGKKNGERTSTIVYNIKSKYSIKLK
jgi:hypothetical protein